MSRPGRCQWSELWSTSSDRSTTIYVLRAERTVSPRNSMQFECPARSEQHRWLWSLRSFGNGDVFDGEYRARHTFQWPLRWNRCSSQDRSRARRDKARFVSTIVAEWWKEGGCWTRSSDYLCNPSESIPWKCYWSLIRKHYPCPYISSYSKS